jgi:pimeloyl-ACP methyl ester carboxylesterase
VIDLAQNSTDLGKVVNAWIHVASSSVRTVSDSVLQSFVTRNISVLSIHGDQDEMGRKTTEKLVNTVNATGVELQGGHRVYLFSPQDFVQEIVDFLGEKSEVKNPSQSPVRNPTDASMSALALSDSKKPDNNDAMAINLSQVTYGSGRNLPYYHCGPAIDSVTTELVLLHGSSTTKEEWKEKGILDDLCDGSFSVTALDFPPGADGTVLMSAFDALTQSSILTGRPVVIVTPSASGTSVTSLAEDNENDLRRVVKAWIPVASPSVLSTSDSALQSFPTLDIPVLAINGDDDGMGRRVTEKLVNAINAKGVELKGGHRVYLFSPSEFVQEIIDFISEENL